ncbi:DUF669 domain-containing protein [Limosilactobacillus fermentum]
MSLRDAMKQATNGFDPKKDSVNKFKGLESGKYTVAVAKVENHETPWNAEQLNFELEVVDGASAGQKEFLQIGLDELTTKGNPNPMLETNLRLVFKLAAILGVEIPYEVWDDDTLIYENLAKVFQPVIGKVMLMDLKVRPNKKNPQYPYRNYDFEEMEQPGTPEVSDDDLPF